MMRAAAPPAAAAAALAPNEQLPRHASTASPDQVAAVAPMGVVHASAGTATTSLNEATVASASAGGPKEAATARSGARGPAGGGAPPGLTTTSSNSPARRSVTLSNSGDPVKEGVRVAPTATAFLATAGEVMVPSPPAAPALPAATTGKKSGCSHANLSKSAARSS